MSKDSKSKSDMGGKGVHSPSNREQTIANAGGQPPTWTVEKIFTEATPPKKYADDSTTGIGKP